MNKPLINKADSGNTERRGENITQGGGKNNSEEVQAPENTGEEKPLEKKDIVIITLLCLYWVLSFFVSNSLEECPSEMAKAVSYTFLLLFGYIWVRKPIRMEPRGS
ncbi:MAG: hypothetical protein HXS44_02055, partial [Theionarchaea archaeon]|nr:hypothetical protein [Theionarchaea archaeon]